MRIPAWYSALERAAAERAVPDCTASNSDSCSSSSSSSSSSSLRPCKQRNPTSSQDCASPSSWSAWNAVRTLMDHNARLCIALELGPDLPTDTEELRVWYAEPVKAVILPTRVFIPNKGGFPVLPRRHQEFVLAMYRRKIQFVISGRPAATPPEAAATTADPSAPATLSLSHYVQYLDFLTSRAPAMSASDAFVDAFTDVLQAPLQPLADNLESATYEVFERDPVKYQAYEDAVVGALRDHAATRSSSAARAEDSCDSNGSGSGSSESIFGDDSSSNSTSSNSSNGVEGVAAVVVLVVGAGRGPLVRRVLAASRRTRVPVRVYAVEKNANAVIT